MRIVLAGRHPLFRTNLVVDDLRSRNLEIDARRLRFVSPLEICAVAAWAARTLEAGSNHERGPTVPRERPARRREERPIPVAKLRPADRSSEHLHLVTEDGVLELQLRHTATPGERSDEADEHEVGEGSQGATDGTTNINKDGTEFWSLTR